MNRPACAPSGPLCDRCQRRRRSILAMYGLAEEQAGPWLSLITDSLRGLCRLGIGSGL